MDITVQTIATEAGIATDLHANPYQPNLCQNGAL